MGAPETSGVLRRTSAGKPCYNRCQTGALAHRPARQVGQNAQPARAEGGTAAPGGEALRDTMPLTLLKSLLPWGTRPRRGALPAAREQAGRPRDARRSSRAEAGLIPQDGRDRLLAPESSLPRQPESQAAPPPLAERESEKEGWESLHPQAPAPVLRPAEQAFPEPGAGMVAGVNFTVTPVGRLAALRVSA